MFQIHAKKQESAAKKADERAAKEKQDAEQREKNLADAKKIVIAQDESLPAATKVKICAAKPFRGKRIKVFGWCHRIR